jgi:hypothetical protein
VRRKD